MVWLRCDQCHSVSRVAFELIQQETPSNRSLISLGQGAKRYQKGRALKPGLRFVQMAVMPASKILAHRIHCN